MQPTLVEVSAGHGCGGIGDGQPHSGVSPLLWGPQALPHGAVELWHGVGHRWSERVGSGLYIHVVVGWLGVCVWGRVCLWESVCVGDCVCRCFCVGGGVPGVSTQPGCMTEKWMLRWFLASCSVMTTCCLCNIHTHTHTHSRQIFILQRYFPWVSF